MNSAPLSLFTSSPGLMLFHIQGVRGGRRESGPNRRRNLESSDAKAGRHGGGKSTRQLCYGSERCRGYGGAAGRLQGHVFQHGRKHAEAPASKSDALRCPSAFRALASFSYELSPRLRLVLGTGQASSVHNGVHPWVGSAARTCLRGHGCGMCTDDLRHTYRLLERLSGLMRPHRRIIL